MYSGETCSYLCQQYQWYVLIIYVFIVCELFILIEIQENKDRLGEFIQCGYYWKIHGTLQKFYCRYLPLTIYVIFTMYGFLYL